MFRSLTSAWFTYGHDRFASARFATVSPQPRFDAIQPSQHLFQNGQSQLKASDASLPEALCRIFCCVVGGLGINGLLPPFTLLSMTAQRPHLWTTIYLSDITPLLLDVVLT